MNRFSIGQAWSYATSFFAGQGANHAIALIGVGIVAPLVIQFALGGGAMMADPMSLAAGGMAAMGGLAILTSLINYVLQTGSYFASWRMGLSNGSETLGSALGFGFIAALPTLLLMIAVVLVLVLIGFVVFGSALAPLAMGGQPGAGTSAIMLLLMLLFFLFLIWLAARFCCTGPVMADQRTFNVLTGLGESWKMTAASQWKIFGYFILLGIALFVVFLILGMIVGVSMFAGGGMPGGGSIVAILIGALLLSIPMAYLQVGVPAGIYRALGEGSKSDVFA
ncbi:glycerophosphoryl diester phosphodiesterase membrane domain-containing protein [Sphingopyxis sp. H115]|uniref:glycerophosphoryl diester phosphodiesterase membrane domain-containing protein n=1 Tax=Sphingopyxis sp. H115 TaxID=1759073 RepID=UPI00073767AE|nr:glycerophosphoryl diester phosphodiesterase membrane domain-containing protein [Sphingopyxis sp. H115]KTE10775.1 hypothetical protein ATE71_12270 [Sphingopyxis sp. H115]